MRINKEGYLEIEEHYVEYNSDLSPGVTQGIRIIKYKVDTETGLFIEIN